MHLTFERPGWLLLLLILVPVAVLAWRSLPHLGRVRGSIAFAVRSLVVLLLTFGLARPALVRDADAACVVVVADASRSVPADLRERAQGWLRERLLSRERPSDRVGVITVAGAAEIQAVPSAAAQVSILSHAGESAASDLASGLRTALALLPGDAINRVLLLTDGVETGGSLAAAADQAAAAGVPVDVVALAPPRSSEVLVDSIRTPARARRGQVIDARVVIRSTGPARGRLRLKVDERTVDLDPRGPGQAMEVALEPGPNAFSVPLPMDRGGAIRVEASFETDAPGLDATVENNVASAITQVAGAGRVAVVSETEAPVDALLQAIRASSLEVEVIPPDLLARRLGSGDFDACVLANVPRWSLDAETDRALRASVHDLGCGLLMLGGDRSFGAGGWQDSETAKAIPVEMNPPQERKLPSGALALIIDCSGSMSATVSGTSATQQQLAAEAAIKAVRALSPSDEVTVIAFSGSSEVVVPLTDCGQLSMIEAGIRAIEPEGGTNLFPALDAAAEQLARSTSKTRHVVVLTDGQTAGDPGEGLAKAMAMGRNGITISTVAIGDGANDGLLARMANAADGRFYSVKDEQSRVSVPQIFIKEAQLIRRSLLWEGEPFTPTRASSAEWMRGGEGVPPIRGYVVAGVRGEPAQTGLLSPSDPPDPILAWWNHGLGRAAAFTSDLGGRWTPAWSSWSGFQPFVGGLVRWLLRPGTPSDVSIRTRQEGDQAMVELEATGETAARVERAEGRVVLPDGSTRALPLRQVAPGRWNGTFPLDDRGAYLVNAAIGVTGGARPLFTQASISVPYPREFRNPGLCDRPALEAIARRTGGRMIQLGDVTTDLFTREGMPVPQALRQAWDLCIILGAALFVIDVAVRRLSLMPSSRRGAPVRRDATRVTEAWRQARQRAEAPSLSRAVEGPAEAPPAAPPVAEIAPPSEPAPVAPPAPPDEPEDDSPMGRLRAAKRRARGGPA